LPKRHRIRATAPPAPDGGACYRLSYGEAVAPTSTRSPVGCDREHTSATYLVGELDTVVDGHLVAVDAAEVRGQVSSACPARFAEHVGGTEEQRRLSVLRPVWFTPTVEESDAGATWFRCDVIAVARDRQLAPLDGRAAGALASEAGRARYGLCGTAEPGAAGFSRVICAEEHSWRAIRTVTFTGPDYPGEDTVRTAGEEPCRAAGRAASADQLDFQWGYEWPTARQWRDGQTYGLCWVPDPA